LFTKGGHTCTSILKAFIRSELLAKVPTSLEKPQGMVRYVIRFPLGETILGLLLVLQQAATTCSSIVKDFIRVYCKSADLFEKTAAAS
jgi:hypothetical protein